MCVTPELLMMAPIGPLSISGKRDPLRPNRDAFTRTGKFGRSLGVVIAVAKSRAPPGHTCVRVRKEM